MVASVVVPVPVLVELAVDVEVVVLLVSSSSHLHSSLLLEEDDLELLDGLATLLRLDDLECIHSSPPPPSSCPLFHLVEVEEEEDVAEELEAIEDVVVVSVCRFLLCTPMIFSDGPSLSIVSSFCCPIFR